MKNLKKTLAVISSAIMLCGGIAPSAASAEEYTYVEDKYTAEEALAAGYDFNLDGIISYSDVYTLSTYYAWSSATDNDPDFDISEVMDPAVVEAVEAHGDITKDGKINPTDGVALIIECKSIIQNGDVNEDGVLDLQDATTILRHYSYFSVGNKEYMNSQECMFVKNIGDINHDGSVNPVDATIIIQTWALNSMQ